jgi:F-type H+-transporting ATPase subunit alpha
MRASEEKFLEGIRTTQKLGEEEQDKLTEIIKHFKKGFAASGGGSVVPDEHVEALDEDEVGKESVKVKKEKPKDKKESQEAKKESKDKK